MKNEHICLIVAGLCLLRSFSRGQALTIAAFALVAGAMYKYMVPA